MSTEKSAPPAAEQPDGWHDWKNAVRVQMLKDTHTHQGKKVTPGDIVELPRAVAEFLYEHGVARPADVAENATAERKVRRAVTRKTKPQPQP